MFKGPSTDVTTPKLSLLAQLCNLCNVIVDLKIKLFIFTQVILRNVDLSTQSKILD